MCLTNVEMHALTDLTLEMQSRDGTVVLGVIDVKAGGMLKFKTLRHIFSMPSDDYDGPERGESFVANGKSVIEVISGQFSLTSETANVDL